jgi:hypothetical protein
MNANQESSKILEVEKKYPPRNFAPNPKEVEQPMWRDFIKTISSNNPEAMQAWINEHPYADNKIGYEAIYNKLHFKSLAFPGITQHIKVDDFNQEQKDKAFELRKILFDIYPLDFQLDLLTEFYRADDFNIDPTLEIIGNLKLDVNDKEDMEQLYRHQFFSKTFSYLFFADNFKAIDQIEQLTGKNFFEDTFEHAFIMLKSPLIKDDHKLFHWVNNNGVIFKPWHNVVFDYTESKAQYLENRGITLPAKKDIAVFRELFSELIETLNKKSQNMPVADKGNVMPSLNALQTGLDLYEKVLTYKKIKASIDTEHHNENENLNETTGPKIKI